MKNALICGAGGFIGHHLTRRLKKIGDKVFGVDSKPPEYGRPESDEFMVADLRDPDVCEAVLVEGGEFQEIYLLAADTGGVGHLSRWESDIMHSNGLMNNLMVHASSLLQPQAKVFFASSTAVYRDMGPGEPRPPLILS